MAFSTNNGGFNRRRGYRGGSSSLAEINIVPLVDVVLVLLIIFMVTAHVMEFGMEVDVPKTKSRKDTAEILPVINVTRSGDLFLADKPINIHDIGVEIQKRFGTQKAAYLRADKQTPWETVAQVVSALHESKLDIRLVTQPVEDAGRRKK